MNWENFDNDASVSKTGKIAFLILITLSVILFSRSFITVGSVIVLISIFLIAYGKELLMPYLNNEFRLLWNVGYLGISIIKVFIVLLKTKGNLNNKDLDALSNYFEKEYNKEVAKDVKEFAKKNFYRRFNLTEITHYLSQTLKTKEKYQLIEQLFRFCQYTGGVSQIQNKTIYKIAQKIKLQAIHYRNIEHKYTQKKTGKTEHKKQQSKQKKQYYKNKQNTRHSYIDIAYSELGVQSSISNNDLKKIYRNLAKQYHPDKFSHRTVFERKKAKEKFQRINNAYSIIKKSRNLK
ncbi:MAG: J domain-containing protein [Bacteroidales bacterium]|nr:J domain-containing protein [Bacteroidales bacterium]